MSEGRVVGPVWWGFVRAGTEHASLAGCVFRFYLHTDPLPRRHGRDGEAVWCCRCRPVPAQADMGPVCCKPDSLKKQHLQGNGRRMMELYLITAVQSDRWKLGCYLDLVCWLLNFPGQRHDGGNSRLRQEASVRALACFRTTSNITFKIFFKMHWKFKEHS